MPVEATLMSILAMSSVGLWTLRVAIAARGMRVAGAMVAAVEAVVFALTFSHLVADLGSPSRLGGYAAGVAAGTTLGLIANDHLAPGHTEVHLVANRAPAELVTRLQDRGWPTTWWRGEGPAGPVTQVWMVVDDQMVATLVADIDDIAPDAFWTQRRLKSVHASPLPPGCRQIRARRAV